MIIYIYKHIYLYVHIDICTYMYTYTYTVYVYCRFKWKTEAQAFFLNPFSVCSSYKWKFVVCPFIVEETTGIYPFANVVKLFLPDRATYC